MLVTLVLSYPAINYWSLLISYECYDYEYKRLMAKRTLRLCPSLKNIKQTDRVPNYSTFYKIEYRVKVSQLSQNEKK